MGTGMEKSFQKPPVSYTYIFTFTTNEKERYVCMNKIMNNGTNTQTCYVIYKKLH
jgi:hypothetical protein